MRSYYKYSWGDPLCAPLNILTSQTPAGKSVQTNEFESEQLQISIQNSNDDGPLQYMNLLRKLASCIIRIRGTGREAADHHHHHQDK